MKFLPFQEISWPRLQQTLCHHICQRTFCLGLPQSCLKRAGAIPKPPKPPKIADKDCYGGSWSHQAWSKPTVYILYKSTLCSTWKCHFFSASNTLRVALSTGRAVRPAAARPWSLLWGPLSCSDHLPGRQKNQPWRQPVVSPTFNIQLISTREDITLFSCYVYTFKYTHKYSYEYTYK